MSRERGARSNKNGRREFLQQAGLLFLAAQMPLQLTGCTSQEELWRGTGYSPYSVWEEMRDALTSSPDHLEGRMKRLIATKDPEAMFNFVREEIHLMPPTPTSFSGMGHAMKWGTRGVLRYGFATPREKAELLVYMLDQASIPAKVVYERTTVQPAQVMEFLTTPIQRTFSLNVSDAQWKRWRKELRIKENDPAALEVFDPGFTQSEALAAKLNALLPDEFLKSAKGFDLRWDNYRTPTVWFESGGKQAYAHLFDRTVAFGALQNNGTISDADPAREEATEVKLSLTYREAIDPKTEKELVAGSWKASDLVGNQLIISFLNGLSLIQQAQTPIGNLRTFTPTFALQSFDQPLEFTQQRSVVGNPFTLEGRQLPLGNQQPVRDNARGVMQKIERLECAARPVGHPLVKLMVTAYDMDNVPVVGLDASHFAISDNALPVTALLESNRKALRVLVLYDTSYSMPEDYYGEGMQQFLTDLENGIRQEFDEVIIDTWGTPSELYTWLKKASRTSYDVILYATDGHNNDVFDPEDEKIYRAGPPALILNVYETTEPHIAETFAKMASLTNGRVLPARDPQKAIDAIREYVSKVETSPYVFTYYAPGRELSHKVSVSLRSMDGVTERTTGCAYQFDGMSEVPGEGIVGMYLVMHMGNTRMERVLAGYDPAIRAPQAKDHVEVRNFILGGATLYIEGEGPTIAASLTDLLTYRLSTRNWGEPLLADQVETAREEFEKGGYQYTAEVLPLMLPVTDGVTTNSLTFASGLRCALVKKFIGLNDAPTVFSFDYLPTSGYTTIMNDPRQAVIRNLQKTAQLALREAAFFDKSTYKELHSLSLIERTQAIQENWFTEQVPEGERSYWYTRIYRGDGTYKLFDHSAIVRSYWQISESGELYGMLWNGTGGGVNEMKAFLDELSLVINVYKEVIGLTPYGNIPLSIVATYGVTLVKLYALASEAIGIMDTSFLEEAIKSALQELACNVAKDIMFGLGGEVGALMGSLDTLIGMIDGKGLFQC